VAEGRVDVRVEGCLIVPDETALPEPDVMGLEPGRHPATALLADLRPPRARPS
jgi:hypothetical protein